MKEMQEPGKRRVLSITPHSGKEQATRGPQETHCAVENPAGHLGSCFYVKTQASPLPPLLLGAPSLVPTILDSTHVAFACWWVIHGHGGTPARKGSRGPSLCLGG